MYPAHTQLMAKCSSPSIGDQRATGWMMRLTPSRTTAMVMKMMRPRSSHKIHWAALLLCLCLGRHISTGNPH